MTIADQAHRLYESGVPYDIPIPDTSLWFLLADAAKNYPRVVALDYFGTATTYRQVLEEAEKGAQVLLDAGVRPGDVVAICLPNCPQAFVAFFACMRIGAVAAEHNPLAPASEIKGQLDRHHGRVAIVWEKSVESFPFNGTDLETVFTVDISAGMPLKMRTMLALPIARARETRQTMRSAVPASTQSWDRSVAHVHRIDPDFPHATGDDRAVILHTGGTNGVPKSVPLTHRNIGANTNQNIFWVWHLHEGAETFFSLLPYFHAFGLTFHLCCSVRKAATQILLPKFDADLALQAHRRRPVSFFVGVPPMFERILARATETKTDLTSIHTAVSGAMPLSEAFAAQWEQTTGGIIVEGYGLSETSPVVSGTPLTPEHRHGVLGVPFPSTQVRLVDLEDGIHDVPDGEPGELLVKGPQVFDGYLDMPEESARIFEDGWLHTGDIAVNQGGYLKLADRKKELILSGGFNVYPSQVEDAIRSMPGISDVAVVGIPIGDEAEEVTAALVLDQGAPAVTLKQIRDWAEKNIAHYALPRSIAIITELPHNALGKVMRRAVKEELLRRLGRSPQAIQPGHSGHAKQPDSLDSTDLGNKPLH